MTATVQVTANDLNITVGNETVTIAKEDFRALTRDRTRTQLLAQMVRAVRRANAITWPQVKAAIEAEDIDA